MHLRIFCSWTGLPVQLLIEKKKETRTFGCAILASIDHLLLFFDLLLFFQVGKYQFCANDSCFFTVVLYNYRKQKNNRPGNEGFFSLHFRIQKGSQL